MLQCDKMFIQRSMALLPKSHFAKRCMCVVTQNSSKLSEENKIKDYVDKNIKPEDWNRAKPFDDIPGPKALPIFGNVFKFMPLVGKYYNIGVIELQERLRKEFGDIVKLEGVAFRPNSVILYKPDDIALAFRNDGPWPNRPQFTTMMYYKTKHRKDVFPNGGLFVGQEKDWYNARAVVNVPMMQPRSFNQYLSVIDDVAQEFIENVRNFASKNPNSEMPEKFLLEFNKFSMESTYLITLNSRLGLLKQNYSSSDCEQFIKCVEGFFQLVYELEFKLSLWEYISTPKYRQLIRDLDFILEFQMKSYKEALSKIDLENLHKKEDSELSILEKMLKRDKENTFSALFDVMFGAVDTVSRTIGAALYFLAINPEIQEKLREEITKFLPTPEWPITKEALNEVSYLRAVIKETQRLAPVGIFGARKATSDLVLSGYQVPKGTEMFFPHLVLCRDEKYFTRPKEFIPERWIRGQNKEFITEDSNAFVYMPFGFGTRMCVGKRFAMLQMEILISRLVRNFQISWPHEEMKWASGIFYGIASPLKLKMDPLK